MDAQLPINVENLCRVFDPFLITLLAVVHPWIYSKLKKNTSRSIPIYNNDAHNLYKTMLPGHDDTIIIDDIKKNKKKKKKQELVPVYINGNSHLPHGLEKGKENDDGAAVALQDDRNRIMSLQTQSVNPHFISQSKNFTRDAVSKRPSISGLMLQSGGAQGMDGLFSAQFNNGQTPPYESVSSPPPAWQGQGDNRFQSQVIDSHIVDRARRVQQPRQQSRQEQPPPSLSNIFE
jgi:hypothetical protein